MLTGLLIGMLLAPAPRGPVDRPPPLQMRKHGAEAPFVLSTSYAFPGSGFGALPTCSSAESCAGQCRVASNHTSWECVKNDGTSLGTVTQGTSTQYGLAYPASAGLYSMVDLTNSERPSMATSPTLDAIWASDWTVQLYGYPTDRGSGFEAYGDWSGLNGGTRYGLKLRTDGTTLNGTFYESTARTASQASNLNGWAFVSARRYAGPHRIVRVSGADGTDVTTSGTQGSPTSGSYYFGAEDDNTKQLFGPLTFVNFYSDDKTAAQLRAMAETFYGLATGAWNTASQGSTGVDQLAVNGTIAVLADSPGVVHQTLGLRTTEGTINTNSWAADALAAGSWTDIGTSTVDSNVSQGPLYTWKYAAEADRINDANAVAFSGRESTGSAGNTAGPYTVSCYLAAGDSGLVTTKARLRVDTDGSGSTNCDFSDLAATFTRRTCTANVTGSPSFVRGRVLVGNATTDTGSILVSQCQLNKGWFASMPQVTNTAKGNSTFILDASGWPSTALGGKYEVIFTPLWNANTEWSGQVDTIYLVDFYDASSVHTAVMLFGYNSAGNAMQRTQNDSGQTQFDTNIGSLSVGQLYAVSLEWRPNGNGTCRVTSRFNTCSGSASACRATDQLAYEAAGQCPKQPVYTRLGDRHDGSSPTDAWISAVRVYSL